MIKRHIASTATIDRCALILALGGLAVFTTTFVTQAHAETLQMLPPTPVGIATNTCPPNTMLMYSGATTGQSAINCVPVVSDRIGNLTASGTVTATGDVNATNVKAANNITATAAVNAATVNATTVNAGVMIASTSVAAPTVVVGGATANATTVNTSNILATFIQTCAKQGGGTVGLDANGNWTCGTLATVATIGTSQPLVTPQPVVPVCPAVQQMPTCAGFYGDNPSAPQTFTFNTANGDTFNPANGETAYATNVSDPMDPHVYISAECLSAKDAAAGGWSPATWGTPGYSGVWEPVGGYTSMCPEAFNTPAAPAATASQPIGSGSCTEFQADGGQWTCQGTVNGTYQNTWSYSGVAYVGSSGLGACKTGTVVIQSTAQHQNDAGYPTAFRVYALIAIDNKDHLRQAFVCLQNLGPYVRKPCSCRHNSYSTDSASSFLLPRS